MGSAQFGQGRYTGVILKDFARTATIAARVHIRCAPDPSQAQDDTTKRAATGCPDSKTTISPTAATRWQMVASN